MPLSGKPAASDQKLRQAIGGSCFSCGMGSHCSLLDKKFLQILRSSLMRCVTRALPLLIASARTLFTLNLKQFIKGHIEEAKLRRPDKDCICNSETSEVSKMESMADIVLSFLSSGSVHV